MLNLLQGFDDNSTLKIECPILLDEGKPITFWIRTREYEPWRDAERKRLAKDPTVRLERQLEAATKAGNRKLAVRLSKRLGHITDDSAIDPVQLRNTALLVEKFEPVRDTEHGLIDFETKHAEEILLSEGVAPGDAVRRLLEPFEDLMTGGEREMVWTAMRLGHAMHLWITCVAADSTDHDELHDLVNEDVKGLGPTSGGTSPGTSKRPRTSKKRGSGS